MKTIRNSDGIPIKSELSRNPAFTSWIAVVRSYNLCSAAILRGIASSGLNLTQHEVMINLLLDPGLNQQELTAKCFSAKSGISAIVSEFEREGLLVRRPGKDDARIKNLYLTEKGQQQAEFNFSVQANVVKSMAGIFSLQELLELETKMNQVSDVLKKMYV